MGLAVGTITEGKGVYCEVESEGKRSLSWGRFESAGQSRQ